MSADRLFAIFGLIILVFTVAALDEARSTEMPTLSPAQEARNQQIEQAIVEASRARWPECKWVTERLCVAPAEWQRMIDEGVRDE